jgi:hypothetical protein
MVCRRDLYVGMHMLLLLLVVAAAAATPPTAAVVGALELSGMGAQSGTRADIGADETFGLCSAFSALLLAQSALANMLQRPTEAVEMVMLTNGSFTHEVNAFFATRGVRVMDALQYPAMRRWAETPSSAYHDGRPSSFERVCMYRVAPTWFTQYDTVLVTDLDLMHNPSEAYAPQGRLWEQLDGAEAVLHAVPLPNVGRSDNGRPIPGRTNPIESSWELVRPNASAYARFEEAVEHGWTACGLWGGRYSEPSVRHMQAFANTFNHRPADYAAPCTAFDFWWARSDQGMWAHLAYDERYGTPSPHEHRMSSWAAPLANPDPGALHEAPFTMSRDGVPYTQTWRMGDENTAANEDSPRVAFAHFAAGQKPWEIYDEADVEPSERPVKRARAQAFWGFYYDLHLRPGFVQRADEQCLTAYDARRLLTERAHEREASRSMKAAASSSLQP